MAGRGSPEQEVSTLAGVSRPPVDLWLRRFDTDGVAGLLGRARGAAREQVPGRVRARILAATKTSPPLETGLSHWSSRKMARFVTRTEGVYVSHHYVPKLWRETRSSRTARAPSKISKDPAFADKVADVIGLYLEPPGGAVVLSIGEKTRAPRGADEAVRDERPAAGHRSGGSGRGVRRAAGP